MTMLGSGGIYCRVGEGRLRDWANQGRRGSERRYRASRESISRRQRFRGRVDLSREVIGPFQGLPDGVVIWARAVSSPVVK
jgi:hypothetical protein